MYTFTNFRTKKSLREAVASGQQVTVFQPGPFGGNPSVPQDGWVTLEGPHYPAPHTWYAQAFLANGVIVKVK